MCIFEILHFVPLALIGLSLLTPKIRSNSSFSLMVAIFSIVGLASGGHSHIEHGAFFGIIDPCNAYLASLVLSSVMVAKSVKAKLIKVNA